MKTSTQASPSTPLRVAPAGPPLRKPTSKDWIFRIAVVVVLLGSVGLAWWSVFFKLLPAQQRSRELATALNRLSAQVDDRERKWSKEQVQSTRSDYRKAMGRLFRSEAALQGWFLELREEAASLGLQTTRVDLGSSVSPTNIAPGVMVIPAAFSLEVRPAENVSTTPYERLLLLLDKLAIEGKRADLAALHVAGGHASVPGAQLVFNFWAGDEKGNREVELAK